METKQFLGKKKHSRNFRDLKMAPAPFDREVAFKGCI